MAMVDAISGGLTVQVDWLGLRVGDQPALSLHSHQMNRVNSHSGFLVGRLIIATASPRMTNHS